MSGLDLNISLLRPYKALFQSVYEIKENMLNQVAISSFRLASNLTDMPCAFHKYCRFSQIADVMHPTASKAEKSARKCAYATVAVLFGTAAVFTTLPGIALRLFATYLQKDPWISEQGTSTKVLSEDGSFTSLFWNICGPGGGYSISDGGVMPLWNRIDSVIAQIVEKDADVNCLCEVFDIEHSVYLAKKLKEKGYTHFYYNISPLPIGVSSGLFVASKYELANPEFLRFPEENLVGRTKYSAKGAFFFDLLSRGKIFATGCTTHMQHSEECQFSSEEELVAKRAQIKLIQDRIQKIAKDRIFFINGDFNGTLAELKNKEWDETFESGNLFEDIKTTWDGDEFCANLVGKRVSGPLFFDYSMIRKTDLATITTFKIDSKFRSKEFTQTPYSDHDGLWSIIRCKR